MTRVVFFGSPREACEVLDALTLAGDQVAAVYTRSDSISGRSKTPEPTPVKRRALELGIAPETPDTLREPSVQARLRGLAADAFVVAAYGRLLPPVILKIPRMGVLNVHPSLLPRHRGPTPVATAILEGDRHTGTTIMLLDEGMDTGPILEQSNPVEIGPADTTAVLTSKLFQIGAGLLIDTLHRWERGEMTPRPQDESLATVTRILERSDGEIDWNGPADRIERKVRAYDPWPGTFTAWEGKNLKVLEAGAADRAHGVPPGSVVASDGIVAIATGRGLLLPRRLQLEGRKALAVDEFVRGHPQFVGARLPS
ncbi:MAG: methionyl-tRNA formyltransferase [Chloroflexi bacterium]|nr:methionyl-tRNA formyltransferase [Chloroflexota bacterium]